MVGIVLMSKRPMLCMEHCVRTLKEMAFNPPQHDDWIYTRAWCVCGNTLTVFRNESEAQRYHEGKAI